MKKNEENNVKNLVIADIDKPKSELKYGQNAKHKRRCSFE